jgi:glycerol-3-phosphate dehydrogenase
MVYDILAGKKGLSSSYFMSREKALETFPTLKSENLKGAIVYYDGSFLPVHEDAFVLSHQ